MTFRIRSRSVAGQVLPALIMGGLTAAAGAQTCIQPLSAAPGDTAGTTVGATGTDTSVCGGGADTAAVWYAYAASITGPVEARTCGGTTNFNTTMSVVADSCAGTPMGCSDNACGIGSIVHWAAEAGHIYLIRIAGVGGATGTFTLRIIESATHTDAAIPLNCNWNGIVHGDAERTLPTGGPTPPIGSTNENRSNLLGFRAFGGDSTGSYAVALLSDPVFNTYTPSSTLPVGLCFDSYGPVGYQDLVYSPSRTTLTKDAVHVGDRSGIAGGTSMSFSASTVMWPSQGGTATTSNGYFPSWLDQYDHTGPQTTSLASFTGNKTFGPDTLIGLVYEATNTVANNGAQKYPSIDATLTFTDGASVTVTLYAPDPVFNNTGDRTLTPSPLPDSGVAVQRQLGLFWGMQGSDRAVGSGAGRVRIAEAVISSTSLQARSTPFNPLGRTLASISFGNPISYSSVANMNAGISNPKYSGFLVYAATLRDAVPAPCQPDFDSDGHLAIADIFAFLNSWFAGESRADVDGINGLQVADIFYFLNLWFAGC